MAWSSGRRNSCPKQSLSESDSSSEEETRYVSNLLKNSSYQNGPCNNSNCTNNLASHSSIKNKPSFGEKSIPENSAGCSNINPNGCGLVFNPVAVCGNSQPSVISCSAKKSNLHSMVGNACNSPVMVPASNAKVGKSVSIPAMNSHPTWNSELLPAPENNVAINASVANNSASSANDSASSTLNAGAQGGLSAELTVNGSPVLNYMTDDQRAAIELISNQGTVAAKVNNSDANQGKVIKLEKSNAAQNNVGNLGPLYNWQASMTTVKERFAFLFNNEVLSDVHFRVGKGDYCQRIPAHKFVLAVGSAVFDAMFYGKLCTRQEEIELPDVEPQAFLALLRFLYSDEVLIGPETVMTVLYTAKKYAVPALERQCVEYLKCNLSPDNAFMLLTQARLFDEPQLASLCLETIDKNTSDALMAEGFTDIDHSTLCMVLERDTLRIREAKLFQAVVRWSEAKCGADSTPATGTSQRALLAEALSLIRFPLMTIEEFAQGPAQSGILTDKEIVQLFLYFTCNPKPPVMFLDVPRCCMTGKEQTVCRFQQIESRWGYSGTSDRIRFIVDRRIFVVGFGMYGSIHGPSEYEVTIQIIHTGTGKVCISNDTTFVSDGTMNTFRVMFKEPFEVLPNTNYTAYATLKGPDSHYGTKGVRKISVECLSGDRVTFQFTYAAGNNNGTSVEDGQIPEIIFYT